MIKTATTNFSTFLESIAEELDITPELHEEAVLQYEDVGDWLGSEGSPLAPFTPEIYPQGSFRLGTVVRPIKRDGRFDVDLVCRVNQQKEQTTQADLKKLVGDRLKSREDLKQRLDESRRCWRLDYDKNFHLDVLPCLPNTEQPPNGLLLTDKDLHHWQKSNPIDYARWFYECMSTAFAIKRRQVAEAMQASVEDVQEWQVKTPLQRVVQILKRHRDCCFASGDENTPTSIIITTLAGHAYRNQLDVQEALDGILTYLDANIYKIDGKWWIPNPAQHQENFADKWNEKPARREAFFNWLARARDNFRSAIKEETLGGAQLVLQKCLGTAEVDRAFDRLRPHDEQVIALPVRVEALQAPPLANHDHIERSRWQERLTHKATIKASTYTANKKKRIAPLGSYALAKRTWIKFTIDTNVREPFEVKWQVVNTGAEAFAVNQLRGGFEESHGRHHRWETVSYAGTHWVEAFVIKDGVCVARSGPKYVKVRK